MSRYTAARVSRQFAREADRESWRTRGSCSDLSAAEAMAIFFPPNENKPEALDLARHWCDTCPVIEQCLAYAMADHATRSYGIYAATGPARREALWRAQQQTRREADGLVALVARRHQQETPC